MVSSQASGLVCVTPCLDVWWCRRPQVQAAGEVPLRHMTDRGSDRGLCKYYMASARTFHGARRVHVAFDASNILRKPMIVGVLAIAGHLATMCPPQVPCGVGQWGM